MKVYLVTIEYRKGGGKTFGPFRTFDTARAAFIKDSGWWTEEKWKNYTEYDSSWEKGTLYTEDQTVEIVERELE